MYSIGNEKKVRNVQRMLNAYEAYSPEKVEKENLKLTDPRLEYQDPTPNIHELFVLFDKRYFWGKLGMVEVKWSQRITTCSGLCHYHEKSGLCSIKLSAPLLSLRPRKDLVETLLHEMIHAYLFVTASSTNREDHGLEFQNHMHRINKEAGTNITVYHTFHDEVAYYQKHIWRCNGQCQNKHPFFGIVKRTMNKEPGPCDSWWQKHQNNCGGSFIKVLEPQKYCKKKDGCKKDKTAKKIRETNDTEEFLPFERPQILSPLNFNASNMCTVTDLDNLRTNLKNQAVTNSDETWSVTSKTDASEFDKDVVNGKKDEKDYLRVRATVRNVWANKYPSPEKATQVPNNLSSRSPIRIEMKRKQITCPVCNEPFSETVINEHIDECLSKEKRVEISRKQDGFRISYEESFNSSLVPCPVCGKTQPGKDLNEHLEVCLNVTPENDDSTDFDKVPCPCCLKWVAEKSMNGHINKCLTYIALKGSANCD